MNTQKFTLFLLCLLLVNIIYSQEVTREQLDSLTFSNREKLSEFIPISPFRNDSELEIVRFDTFRNTKQSKKVQDYVFSWKVKNNITDDGETDDYFGIFRSGSNYFIRKVSGTTRYMLEEPFVDKKIYVEQNSFDEIICLFKPNISLTEKQLNPILIKPQDPNSFLRFAVNKDNVLEKNVRFTFEFKNQKYVLLNEASLLKEDWGDSYFDLKLSLNDSSGKTQVLVNHPSIIQFDITGITILDIDNDDQPDFIISTVHETSTRRLIYLSGKADNDYLVKYVGYKITMAINP